MGPIAEPWNFHQLDVCDWAFICRYFFRFNKVVEDMFFWLAWWKIMLLTLFGFFLFFLDLPCEPCIPEVPLQTQKKHVTATTVTCLIMEKNSWNCLCATNTTWPQYALHTVGENQKCHIFAHFAENEWLGYNVHKRCTFSLFFSLFFAIATVLASLIWPGMSWKFYSGLLGESDAFAGIFGTLGRPWGMGKQHLGKFTPIWPPS